jgi:hypothetical protein
MASPFVFTDGFDVYGPPGVVPILTTQWTTVSGTVAIVAGLSSSGYAVRLSANTFFNKTLPASFIRVAGSVRFSSTLGGLSQLVFQNSATAAFCLSFETTGAINLRTGNQTGAIIATGAAILANSTHVLSWDITIGGAGVGTYVVNLDGVLLYSGTGNTGNSQASVNVVAFGAGNSVTLTVDDLIIADPTQSGYNSAILTSNPVIETQWVSGDTQTQFANDGNVVPLAVMSPRGVYRTTTTSGTTTAGSLYLAKITADINCTLNSITIIPNVSNAAAKYKAVLYADSGGAPSGAPIDTGVEVTGPVSTVAFVMPLTTPRALTGGASYWVGFINDTAVNLQLADITTNAFQRKANTYASGPPNPVGAGFTTGVNTFAMWANCTGAAVNWPSLSLSPPLGTAQAQTHSSTVGQEDLFGFPPLVTNPTTIFGIAVKGFVSKSDAGARTASFNTKSGASDTTGSAPGQALSTTPQWQASYFDVDSATGLPWMAPGANAAKAGVSVAS